MRVVLLFNPASGKGRSALVARQLGEGLRADGHSVELLETRRAVAGRPSSADRSDLAQADLLVVCGGDGAVRLASQPAVESGTPLWHAPCGTENLFARSFGMSPRIEALREAIARFRTQAIDVGNANGEPFLIMASVGFDAEVVRLLDERRRGGISHFSYAGPILRSLLDWRAPDLAWEIDGERESLGRGMVVVGNLPEYGVRLNPAVDAIADDGELDAVFLPARSGLELAGWVPFLLTGTHVRHPAIRQRRGKEISVVPSQPTGAQVDGDTAAGGARLEALRLRLMPRALRVLLPAR